MKKVVTYTSYVYIYIYISISHKFTELCYYRLQSRAAACASGYFLFPNFFLCKVQAIIFHFWQSNSPFSSQFLSFPHIKHTLRFQLYRVSQRSFDHIFKLSILCSATLPDSTPVFLQKMQLLGLEMAHFLFPGPKCR